MACNFCNSGSVPGGACGTQNIVFPDFVANSCCNPCCAYNTAAAANGCGGCRPCGCGHCCGHCGSCGTGTTGSDNCSCSCGSGGCICTCD